MPSDPAGNHIGVDDLVVWYGKAHGQRAFQRLGVVVGVGWFTKVFVQEAIPDAHGDWDTVGEAVATKSHKIMVIGDLLGGPS
jgi:hypothetical protein